ncbi:unnamed protein product [Amoebophrya sp. A25]|nr:unnamed protein product [Amoebophrya sp. A25]|eukprot:GSA25T00017773001.1
MRGSSSSRIMARRGGWSVSGTTSTVVGLFLMSSARPGVGGSLFVAACSVGQVVYSMHQMSGVEQEATIARHSSALGGGAWLTWRNSPEECPPDRYDPLCELCRSDCFRKYSVLRPTYAPEVTCQAELAATSADASADRVVPFWIPLLGASLGLFLLCAVVVTFLGKRNALIVVIDMLPCFFPRTWHDWADLHREVGFSPLNLLAVLPLPQRAKRALLQKVQADLARDRAAAARDITLGSGTSCEKNIGLPSHGDIHGHHDQEVEHHHHHPAHQKSTLDKTKAAPKGENIIEGAPQPRHEEERRKSGMEIALEQCRKTLDHAREKRYRTKVAVSRLQGDLTQSFRDRISDPRIFGRRSLPNGSPTSSNTTPARPRASISLSKFLELEPPPRRFFMSGKTKSKAKLTTQTGEIV